jgi:hypothetical protein
MIIYRDNIKPNEEIVKLLSEEDFKTKYSYDEQNIVTTYFYKDETLPKIEYKNLYQTTIETYTPEIDNIMKKFDLYQISEYRWECWYQVYDEDMSGHKKHSHFSGSEIFSFVHFLSVPDQPCFYFLFNGEKKYIEEKNGDIIVFPSWLMHGVDAVHSGERKILSGNVTFNNFVIEDNKIIYKKEWNNNCLWTTVKT